MAVCENDICYTKTATYKCNNNDIDNGECYTFERQFNDYKLFSEEKKTRNRKKCIKQENNDNTDLYENITNMGQNYKNLCTNISGNKTLRDIHGAREYTFEKGMETITITSNDVKYIFKSGFSVGGGSFATAYVYTCSMNDVTYEICVKRRKFGNNKKENEVYKLFKKKGIKLDLEMDFPDNETTVCDKYDGTLKTIKEKISELEPKMHTHCNKFILKQIFNTILIALEKDIGMYGDISMGNILFKCDRNSFRVILADIDSYVQEYTQKTLNSLMKQIKILIGEMYAKDNILTYIGKVYEDHIIEDMTVALDNKKIYKIFKEYTDTIIDVLNGLIENQHNSSK